MIHELFKPISDVELDLPPREPMRGPPPALQRLTGSRGAAP